MKRKFVVANMLYAGIFIVLIAIDRVTKQLAIRHLRKQEVEIIPDILSFHYLENRGAAWGWFQNATWLFILVTFIVLAAMVYFYSRIPLEKRYRWLRISIIVLSAGAVGNFIDRIIWRYVVDFIYVTWINFPVFNVADCFVCISAVMLLYCLLFKYKDEEFFGKRNHTN